MKKSNLKNLSCCLILALTVVCPTVYSYNDVYVPRADVNFKGGNKRLLGNISFLFPLWQRDDRLIFTNIIGMTDSKSRFEGNFGGGYRQLMNDKIIGAYTFYDIRRTKNSNTLMQITLGGELLFTRYEFRGNVYLPISDKQKIDNVVNIRQINTDGPTKTRVHIYSNNRYDVPMYGFDIEAGGRFLNTIKNLNCFGAFYFFNHKDLESMKGARLRANYKLLKFVSLNGEISYDNIRKVSAYLGIRFTYNFENASSKKLRNSVLKDKMTSLIVRDVDIVSDENIETISERKFSTPLKLADGEIAVVYGKADGKPSLAKKFNGTTVRINGNTKVILFIDQNSKDKFTGFRATVTALEGKYNPDLIHVNVSDYKRLVKMSDEGRAMLARSFQKTLLADTETRWKELESERKAYLREKYPDEYRTFSDRHAHLLADYDDDRFNNEQCDVNYNNFMNTTGNPFYARYTKNAELLSVEHLYVHLMEMEAIV